MPSLDLNDSACWNTVRPEVAALVGNASVAAMAAVPPPSSNVVVSGHLEPPLGECGDKLSNSGMGLRQVSKEREGRVEGRGRR